MNESTKKLYRIPNKGKIFGVCAGLAEYFTIDVTLMRVIFVVAALATGGTMIAIYLVLALVMPVEHSGKDARETPENLQQRVHELERDWNRPHGAARTRNIIGIGLLILGAWLLLGQVWPFWFRFNWSILWPVVLIGLGCLILARRGK